MQHSRLGILGGMGPQATLLLCQRVLDSTDAVRDQEHIPTLVWNDTLIPDRTAAILGGDAEGCYAELLSAARLLERAGCTVLAIPCNTSHYFADRLQSDLSVPLLNMPRLAVDALASRSESPKKVCILATDGTVRTGVYQRECAARGLACAVPDDETQKAVMHLIYDVVKAGKPGTEADFAPIDAAVTALGCDCAILACTELSVYRAAHPLPARYLDALDLLARACVSACGYPLRGA